MGPEGTLSDVMDDRLRFWLVAALNTFRRKGGTEGRPPDSQFLSLVWQWECWTYLDITGFITVSSDTFGFALGAAEEENVGFLHRMWAALLAAFGGAVGFFVSIAVDACVSGNL